MRSSDKRDGSGAQKTHAAAGRRLRQLIAHDTEDDLVAHQLSGLHDRARLEAQRCAPPYRVAQEVAGGELRQAQVLREKGALGALASAGRAEEVEVHVVGSGKWGVGILNSLLLIPYSHLNTFIAMA